MTKFDADAPEERQKLFAEGIVAHRERGSAFVTFEAHRDASASASIGDADDEAAGDAESRDGEAGDEDSETAEDGEPEEAPPWIQFGDSVSSEQGEDEARRGAKRSGGVLNLDCTDDELDDLKSLLGDFPAFKIDDIVRPEEAEGVNVRVSALADPNRVAQCIDRIFREVYDQPDEYRAWITAV